MTTYGTIPPSSSSPPSSLEFFSGAKQRGLSALTTRRPWREMIHAHAFSLPPSLGEAYLRIRTNASYFSMNYAIIVFVVAFLSLLWHPLSLLIFVATIAAWIFLYFLRDQPLVIGGQTFDNSYVLIGLSVSTVVLLLVTNATENIVGSVVSGFVVVLVHAMLRRTDDLQVDEEGARGSRWFAVVGESGGRPLPAS